MKKIIIAILILIPISLFADEIGILKVYDEEGNYKTYDLNEIEKIEFDKKSHNLIYEIYLMDGIKNIFHINFTKKISIYGDELYIKNVDNSGSSCKINQIDSIIFKPYNIWKEKKYENVIVKLTKIDILMERYNSKRYIENVSESKDTVQYKKDCSIELKHKTLDNKNAQEGSGCGTCYFDEIDFDLFFCNHNNLNGEHDRITCEMKYVKIYLNKEKNKIDSLILKKSYSSSFRAYSTTGSESNLEMIKLFDIEYNFDNGVIIVNKLINDNEKVEYIFEEKYSRSDPVDSRSWRKEVIDVLGLSDNSALQIRIW